MNNYSNPSVRMYSHQTAFPAAKPRPAQASAQQGRISWFNSYNEEWEACSEEHAILNRRAATNETEALPRVWNTPGGYITRR